MATKGRGGDSMLVHMTPGEVQALQALAQRHGGTLTINPETGQPEANFLKKLLPAIAGAALNFFAPGVGTAVGGMFGLGAAAGTGIAVGGISALATGSLSRGLMAGLGAYGGASLVGGAQALGSTAVTPEAMAAANASADPIMSLTAAKDAATAAGITPAVGAEAAKQGLSMAANNPGSFVTAMGGPAKAIGATYAAASPLMAADTVETTTPRQDTGYIRQKKFNPYTQQYIDLEPVKASEWGSRSFSDYADGGIVALANGGTPPTVDQNYVNQLVREAAQQAGGTLSFADASNAARNLGVSPAMLSSAAASTGLITGAPTADKYFSANPDVAAAFQQNSYGLTGDQFAQVHFNKYGQYEDRAAPVMANVAPTAIRQSAYGPNSTAAALGASHIVDGIELVPGAPGYDPAKAAMRQAEISTYGDTGAANTLRANNLYDTGMAQWQTEYNRLHQQDIDAGRVPVGTPAAKVGAPSAPSGLSAAAQYSMLNSDVGVGADKVGGLRGLNSLVLDFMKQYPNATQAEINAAKNLYGYNDADVVRPYEHGFQLMQGQEAAAQKYLQDNPDVRAWLNTSEGRQYLAANPEFDATDIAYTHYERYGKNEGRTWGLPVSVDTAVNLPGGVSGGGNTIVNDNGTITTAPNIPGRPAGGFTGMGQVRDAYTQGGGSLGQSNLFVPKTLDEMYARYGNTGGSEQAYDYLMGKGAADIKKPVTQSGELMLPYSQAVLGQEIAAASGPATQKFLFDRRTRRYIPNPAYVDPNAPKETSTTEVQQDSAVGGANGGVMRMALGGLGSLAGGGQAGYNLGGYSDGGRLLRGPGDGVSDSIPATIGNKQPARLADGEFVVPARIVSELGNGSTEAGARKLYAMMDRVQKARGKTTGKNRVAANTRSEKYLPA
jgi:hypothetical protein